MSHAPDSVRYPDGPEEPGCPRFGSDTEPTMEEGTYEGRATCPACGHTDTCLTPEGEAEQERRSDEARAAEAAYYAAEDAEMRARRSLHTYPKLHA